MPVEPGLTLSLANAWKRQFGGMGMDIEWAKFPPEFDDLIESSEIGAPDVSELRWNPWIFALPVGTSSSIKGMTWDNTRFGWWWHGYIVATRCSVGILVLPRNTLLEKVTSPISAVWPYTSLTQVTWSENGRLTIEINGGLKRFTKPEVIDGGHELVIDYRVPHNDLIPALVTSSDKWGIATSAGDNLSAEMEDRRSFMQIIGTFWQQVAERHPAHFVS